METVELKTMRNGDGFGAVYENGVAEWKADPPAVRLNLGAGDAPIPGFTDVDRKNGSEVFPLAYEDNSVDEIVACHILEHFSHRNIAAVLAHWVAKLKPGGRIRIAVPDFAVLAQQYLDNEAVNVQGHVLGGHVDENDRHGAIFDRESLTELMSTCGLERIGRWDANLLGCAQHPCSLNLQGFKPAGPHEFLTNVRGVMSTPRFGPLLHPECAKRAFLKLRLPAKAGQSCFWHQKISAMMEEAIAEPDCDFVLTLDFDTIFSAEDVLELYRLMHAHPEVDALFPLQSKRGCEQALFSVRNAQGGFAHEINSDDLTRNILPVNTGHFGLTMFRAEVLRKFPRPWMLPIPAKDGTWEGEGQMDPDIDFWRRFKLAGFKCFLAPKVVVGHLEEVVKWPGRELKPVYQTIGDYETDGIPADVQR